MEPTTVLQHTNIPQPRYPGIWPSAARQLADAIPLPCWIEDVDSGELLAANDAGRDQLAARRGSAVLPDAECEVRVSELELDGRRARMSVAVDAPKALREREAQLRALVDGSIDIIYECDVQGHFTFVSAGAEAILGFPSSTLVGRHYSELIAEGWRARVLEHYQKQRLSPQPSTLLEFPVNAADGRIVWVSQNVQTVREGGRIVGYRAIARDITTRRRAEERFHAFMNNTPTAAYIKDEEGRYVYANSVTDRLFARDGGTVVGLTDAAFLPPEVAAEIAAHDAEVIRGGTPLRMVETAPVDGAVRHWLTWKFPVAEDGASRYVGGVSIDLTERLDLERDLAAARDAALDSARDKAQFLANMSHEIRTPMNGVIGLLGVLLDTNLTADQRDLAETARSSADSLLTIINDILDFSKIEAGKLSFEVLDFDVRATCESVIDLLAETARAKSLEIGFVADAEIPRTLRGDPGRLRQVLLNLAGNAVKFTAEGGVLLQVDREADSDGRVVLRFRVTDTGVGVPPEARPRLFQPFMQADAGTTRRFGGTGLGLAISRELVRMMDGEIGVESEPDCGSTFWFTASFECAEPSEHASGSSSETRVLIVEDSTTARHLLALQLATYGLQNECADNGLTALAMLRHAAAAGAPFDVVLTDLQMPELDGIGLARVISGNTAFGKPRVVLVTNASDSYDAAALSSAGIAQALRKPVKPRHLLDALLAKPAEPRPAAEPAPPVAATVHPGSRRRILVADDNAVNQKVALRQLQKLGFAADAVGHGLEAIDAVSRIAYDLVLMDCQMPEMDGYEATALIRKSEAGTRRHLPILALTASASEADRERCLAAGMDDFITKPVREEALRSAISRWLAPDTEETHPTQ